MTGGARFPTQFRRRLGISFVLACSMSAAVLGLSAFALSWQYRWNSFERRAADQASTAAALLNRDLRPTEISQVVEVFQELDFADVVAVRGPEYFSSNDDFTRREIPDALRAAKRGTSARTTVKGNRYVVITYALPASPTRLFFFFSAQPLLGSLRELALILSLGWLTVTASAAIFGAVAARRTLSPVTEAAEGARALAEGLLDTRLEVSGGDEFSMWATSFNEMAEAFQRKLDELSVAHERERRFTGNVAHELMTPIGALVAAGSVLEQHLADLPVETRRMAELMVSDSRRLRTLAEELLELARLDATDAVERLHPLDLASAVRRAVRSIDDAEDVSVRIPANLIVLSEPICLERILTNLVHNALRHGRAPVEVSARAHGATVLVDIDDQGDGIPEADRERIFDRFYKRDSSRSVGGAGLGLAIVSEIARLTGAKVGAARNRHGGARFTVEIPAAVD